MYIADIEEENIPSLRKITFKTNNKSTAIWEVFSHLLFVKKLKC